MHINLNLFRHYNVLKVTYLHHRFSHFFEGLIMSYVILELFVRSLILWGFCNYFSFFICLFSFIVFGLSLRTLSLILLRIFCRIICRRLIRYGIFRFRLRVILANIALSNVLLGDLILKSIYLAIQESFKNYMTVQSSFEDHLANI